MRDDYLEALVMYLNTDVNLTLNQQRPGSVTVTHGIPDIGA